MMGEATHEHPAASTPFAEAPLPTIVCSSVIRSVHQGESHGGVYLVDLEPGDTTQVIDWSDDTIDWEGRGGDRGLRGIAFHDGLIYLAASDEVFVYDREFARKGRSATPTSSTVTRSMCRTAISSRIDRLRLGARVRPDHAAFHAAWCLRYSTRGSCDAPWPTRQALGPRLRPLGPAGPARRHDACQQRLRARRRDLRVRHEALGTLAHRRTAPAEVRRHLRSARTTRARSATACCSTTRRAIASSMRSRRPGAALGPLPTYRATASSTPTCRATSRGPPSAEDSRCSTTIVVGGSSPATITAFDLDAEERFARSTSRWTCATRFTASRSGPSTTPHRAPTRTDRRPLPAARRRRRTSTSTSATGSAASSAASPRRPCGRRYR